MKKIISLVMLMVLAIGTLTGCGSDQEKTSKAQLVKTEVAGMGENGEAGNYAGVVKGRYETNMSFQVGGRITNRQVQLGDRVTAGQALMVIDARDVQQKSNQGDAQVAAAKAQLDLASSNLNRYSQLYAQQAVPASVLDQYQTAYEAAQASYYQATAVAQEGHNALGYTTLVAGSDGVVAAVNAEAGQVVAAGQPVLTLVQDAELEVEISIPENHLGDVTLGKNVEVTFWALKNQKATGVIREISPMADSISRTYKVRVAVAQPPAGMKLGMTANVSCSVDATSAGQSPSGIILPMSAIYQTGDQPQVWVVEPETKILQLKNVTVDNFGDNKVKVTGIAVGDIVVVAGVHKLREGLKVRLSEDEE